MGDTASQGLQPDPEKVAMTQKMPIPEGISSDQTLSEFANLLTTFLPKLLDICNPLIQ